MVGHHWLHRFTYIKRASRRRPFFALFYRKGDYASRRFISFRSTASIAMLRTIIIVIVPSIMVSPVAGTEISGSSIVTT